MLPTALALSPVAAVAIAAAIMVFAAILWARGLPLAAIVLATFAGFGFFVAAAPSLAQTAEDLVDLAQRRAAEQAPAAQALFDAAEGRQERYRAAAQAVVDQAAPQRARGFVSLQGLPFAAVGQGPELGPPAAPGVVYIAVSFSMPAGDLRQLGRDAHNAGAVLVIRGLVHGSFKETLLAARQVFDEESLGGVAIDPNVFRAFNIQATPTFIAASAAVEPCGPGLDCRPAAPPHDRLSGNVSLKAALRLLATQAEDAPGVAAAVRDRLGGS